MSAPPSVPRVPRVPKHPPPPVCPSPRLLALEEEVATADDAGEAAAAAFWSEVDGCGTPLVEPDPERADHRIVTFLHRADDVDVVVLRANKLTDPSCWEESTLRRVGRTDVWHRSYRLRQDYLGTYELAPGSAGSAPADEPVTGPALRWRGLAGHAVPDPRNPRRFPAKGGGSDLSLLALDGAPPQPEQDAPAVAVPGVLERSELAAPALGGVHRAVLVHRPAGTVDPDVLVLVVLDGEDWAGRLRIGALLDAHRARGGRPVLALLCPQGDTTRRWEELGLREAYVAHLADELLPWARTTYGVRADRAATVVAGQSLGGLTALWCATRAPEAFGGVLAQSSSLWYPEGVEDAAGGRVVDELARAPADVARTRFHVEVGLEEWMLLERHRRLRDVLAGRAAHLSYRERAGGHDAVLWRVGLAEGLRELAG